jgi:hypothetical protein
VTSGEVTPRSTPDYNPNDSDAVKYLQTHGAYRSLMDSPHREVRYYTVRGRHLRVFPAGRDQWGVTVDGTAVGVHFSTSHSAWAAGVAESYRRGPGEESRTLAALAARAAARQSREPPFARPGR